ncbi:MAG: hypothetical protein RLO38_16510 [Roseovarius confluentis]
MNSIRDYILEKANVMEHNENRQAGKNTPHHSSKLVGEVLPTGFLEFAQTLNNSFVDISKRWNDLGVRKRLGWAEGYLNGSFELALKIQLIGRDGQVKGTYLARFYSQYVILKMMPIANHFREQGECSSYDDIQRPVLICSVDLIQAKNRRVRSLCVVHLIQEKRPKATEAMFFESAVDGAFEVFPVLPSVPSYMGGIVSKVMRSIEGRDSIVETGTERPYGFSYNEIGIEGERIGKHINSGGVIISLGDKASDSAVTITRGGGINAVDLLRVPLGM